MNGKWGQTRFTDRAKRGRKIVSVPDFPLILLAVLLLSAPALATDADTAVAKAIEQTKKDIDAAGSILNDVRKTISDERTKLSRDVSVLSAEVTQKREARRHRMRLRDQSDIRLQDLEDKAESLKQQISIIRTLLVETRRNTETQLHIVDAAARAGKLAELDGMLETAGVTEDAVPAAARRLMNLVEEHTAAAAGIRRSSGTAIGPDGREFEGTFVQIGSVTALFSPEDENGPAGIVKVEHGSSRPHVWDVPDQPDRQALAAAAKGTVATVPLDVTSGAVFRAAGPKRSLTEQVKAGGVVMIPIIAIALVCMAIGLWKTVQLARVNTDFDAPLARLLALLREGNTEGAAAMAKTTAPPLRRLMEEGVLHANAAKEQLEEIMHEAIIVETPPLERHLSMLAVGAAVSPLLGLLGTVTGMIRTFNQIAIHGTGNPRLLSGGISEALITTEAGLMVAIPLLLLHAFLSRRVRSISDGLETSAVSFINTLKTREDR